MMTKSKHTTHVDVGVVDRETAEVGERATTFCPALPLGEEPGRFGGEHEADKEQSGPDHLQTDGDTPAARL